MNIQEIVDVIAYIEKKYQVDKWKIDDIPLWPFIRIENYYLLSLILLNGETGHDATSGSQIKQIIDSKLNLIRARANDKAKEAKPKRVDVLFLGDGISFAKLNNTWYQKFCDPIADQLNKENISNTRFDLADNFHTPRYSASIFIQSKIDNAIIVSKLKSKLISPKFKSEKWEDYEQFLNDPLVKDSLVVVLSKSEMRKKIAKIKALISYYNTILEDTKPKICYIGAYYGDHQLAFILACKKLGIKTVDIQHGVQGEFHLAYSNWLKVPNEGYAQLPDYFSVWSEEEKTCIEKWNNNLNTHKVVVSGNLFANMWKLNDSDVVKAYDIKVNDIIKFKDKPVVLLTLSPYTEDETKKIYKIIKETQLEFNWLIRLHPGMLKKKAKILEAIKKHKIVNFELEESSDLPLYSILRNIDLHITVQSTCVIEAAEFGVKSIITSEYGRNLYLSSISNGDAVYLNNTSEIISYLSSHSKNSVSSTPRIQSTDNIISFTKKIIEN